MRMFWAVLALLSLLAMGLVGCEPARTGGEPPPITTGATPDGMDAGATGTTAPATTPEAEDTGE